MYPRKILFGLLSCYVSSTLWLLRLDNKEKSMRSHLDLVFHRSLLRKQFSEKKEEQLRKQSPFGLVMQQFSKRVLSRHITSSNVLVVFPEANAAATTLKSRSRNNETSVEPWNFHSMGARFLYDSFREGHSIHAIDSNMVASVSLDDWWNSFGSNSGAKSGPEQERPSWILLAVFDLPWWEEDAVWGKATQFLTEATVTYIVLAMHSVKERNGSYRYGGLQAAEQLLERRYKLQTLSVSHYHADSSNEKQIFQSYGPNALFQSVEEIKNFLQWGADSAKLHGNEDDVFKVYIFATQGLDLAIPSAGFYIADDKVGMVDPLKGMDARDSASLKRCPRSKETYNIELHFEGESLVVSQQDSKKTSPLFSVMDRQQPVANGEYLIWMDGKMPSTSEAACVKEKKRGKSKCTTRILQSAEALSIGSMHTSARPNILLVLLDPISKAHFERVMPLTGEALQQLHFTAFQKYVAVGANSGPNQAALYAGMQLQNRNGIRNDHRSKKWLWDQLRMTGYVTLKGEDGCVENSNMVQSLSPNTTHGNALHGLFCFDAFSRPNCIGPDAASTILLSYSKQFIQSYEKLRKTRNKSLRWASFVHFTDSHEDTMTLASTIDKDLSQFLHLLHEKGIFNQSLVILCSDHGLHYGPIFSTRQGRREAIQPILNIRVPESLKNNIDMGVFNQNARKYTTSYDLHKTILNLAEIPPGNGLGHTLTTQLPRSRHECRSLEGVIPPNYCELLYDVGEQDNRAETEAITNISRIDSFFRDIPMEHRPKMKFDTVCCKKEKLSEERRQFEIC